MDGAGGLRRRLLPRLRFVRAGALVAAGVGLATLLNAILQAVLARVLVPSDYSALTAIFAALTICTVPTLALQASVARGVAASVDDAAAAAYLRGALRATLKWTAWLTAAAAALGVPLAIALHVSRVGALVAAAVTLFATAAIPVAWGGLQGRECFGALSAAQLGWASLRFALAVALGAAGLGVGGILAGIAAATVATAVLSFVPLRRVFGAGDGVAGVRLATGYNTGAALCVSLFTALTTTDVLAARVSLTSHVAGLYSAASVGARSVILVAVTVATVLFPHVAKLKDRARERRHLRAAALVVLTVGGAGVLLGSLVPRLLLRLAFGGAYQDAASYLVVLLAASALYGLVYVYMFHFLSLGAVGFAATMGVALALQLALYAAFHDSGRELAFVQLGTALALAAGGELHERRLGT